MSKIPNIVVLGHTHGAMLKNYDSNHIYVNTGAWLDNIPDHHPTTTYVEIVPTTDDADRDVYKITLYDYRNKKVLENAIVPRF